ncbi:MAG: DUF3368 domain-containing protein [Chloroflexi bacterium]|nr:DUF3368 domain-containing protein [Chloroflexota bacterium]
MLAVVSDSSPLIYFTRLDQFTLLRQLYDHVLVPPAVWRELAVQGKGRPEAEMLRSAVSEGWIELAAPGHQPGPTAFRSGRLDPGEQEAILLAREKQALLIIDETRGRKVARELGIKVTGTLGVLVEAKQRNLLPSIKESIDRLRAETTFHLSDETYEFVLQMAGEAPPKNPS